MNIYDFYLKYKYKTIIKELGFNKSTPSILLLPIENKSNYEPSGHFLILKRSSLVSLEELFSFKKGKNRIIYKAFIDWINSPVTLEVSELPSIIRTKERWLYLHLENDVLMRTASFEFLCSDCNRIYSYYPQKSSLEPFLEENNTANNGNPIWEIRHSGNVVYDVLYCPGRHMICERVRAVFDY